MVNTFQGYVELTGRQNLALMTRKNNSHLPEFQRVRRDVSKRWLRRMNQFLQLSNRGTGFYVKVKDIVDRTTLDPTKQDNLLRHAGFVRCSLRSGFEYRENPTGKVQLTIRLLFRGASTAREAEAGASLKSRWTLR